MPVVLCDAVHSLGVHNGVTRIAFVRLNAGGDAVPAVELLIPNFVLSQMIRALQTVKV
jgi:hypothetical protein